MRAILENIIEMHTIEIIGNAEVSLDGSVFDAIEYDDVNDRILLHIITENVDYIYDYEILDIHYKIAILTFLRDNFL